eukprot:TRINITY_DN103792_c0_g1_i1.p1 TRINITY_DN103792_c0_g1~~TRINITY_DN103792_c0_g1_i1.p1  ORF type:complete len:181 (+),score=35.88 TRINITY_DN103792_c0_g1_i1:32-544(+)
MRGRSLFIFAILVVSALQPALGRRVVDTDGRSWEMQTTPAGQTVWRRGTTASSPAAAAIVVTAPKHMDVVAAGAVFNVTWTSANLPANDWVSIQLFRGRRVHRHAFVGAVSHGVRNQGFYPWLVEMPESAGASQDSPLTLRVTSHSDRSVVGDSQGGFFIACTNCTTARY